MTSIDGRSAMVAELAARISRCAGTAPLVVGLTGIDGSGKSVLAEELRHQLVAVEARDTTVVRVDDFHRPRAERYRVELPEADQYYMLSIDFGRLVEQVLRPIREVGMLRATVPTLDVRADRPGPSLQLDIAPRSIVVVEGVFLCRPETLEWLDLIVYVEATESEVLRRVRRRDTHLGASLKQRYGDKYFAAQHYYIAAHHPHEAAHAVVDNDDLENPRLQWKGCR